MSKYTTLLRWPIEQRLDDLGLAHSEDNWPEVYGFVGLSDYPIFDESHRQTLNDKIIRRYYFREIGFETFALFRWRLREHMFEVMPYFNQLYESELLVTEPMYSKNMDYAEKWTRDEVIDRDTTQNVTTDRDTATDQTTHTESTSHTVNDARNVFQDTPMNGLDTGAIESMDYATSVTYDDSTTDTNSTSDATLNRTEAMDQTEDLARAEDEVGDYDGTKVSNEKGYDGGQSELLLKYRDTFLNIDLDVVNSCRDLFMCLW